MENEELSAEQRNSLAQLAENANEKLVEAGQSGANQAFNLGCTASLAPGFVIVLLAFFLGRGSWVVAFVAMLFVLLGIVGVANLAAFVAKSRYIQRAYELNVNPEIERALKGMDLSRTTFNRLAFEALPQGAPLHTFLPALPQSEQAGDE